MTVHPYRASQRLRCAGLLFLLSIGLALQSAAVDFPLRWRWCNPAPHGGNVFDMAYGMGLTVQVCERGQIYVSDDLKMWRPLESGTTNSLRGVTFFGNRIVISGENGTILYADSLENWNVLSLNTSDWLEGIAASDSTIVAVGDHAAIYVSPDATNWTRQTVSFTNWLRGVAYGNNTFVAVGESGFIATRTGTGSWTPRTSGTSRHLNRVTFVNNGFYAVGEGGICLAGNAAGQIWSVVPGVGTTNTLYGVAGTNVSLLVCGDKEVRLQENGGSWSNQTAATLSFPAPVWTFYDALWEGGLYLIAGRSGMMAEGFRTNGEPMQWITREDSIRTWLWDVTRTPDFYVAAGDRGTILTSSDGANWDLELVPNSVTNSIFLGIGGDTNVGLLAVGNKGTMIFSPNVFTTVLVTNGSGTNQTIVSNQVSTLGINWQSIASPTTNDLQGVATFSNTFVLSGAMGTILTSTNGTNWVVRSSPTTAFLSSVASFPGGLVATGDRGAILASTNGVTWVARASGTTNWIYRVRYINGQLIAVGENGTVLTSGNGVTWTPRTSNTSKWLNAVEFAEGFYFIAGNQGTVLVSSNLVSWTNIGTITQKSLYGLAWNNGQLVAVGIEGAILRSPLRPVLDPVTFLKFSHTSNENVILVSGKVDQRFTVQHGSDLSAWTDGVTLEMVDRSGTLLFLENLDTNSLPQEFIRARMVP